MASKKSANDNSTSNTQPETSSELNTLREIVFGAAKNDIEQRMNSFELKTEKSFQQMNLLIEKNTQTLKTAMQQGFEELEDKLALADQSHDEKATELNVYADKISSELEMAEAHNKQENDELHQRLDKEVQALTQNFTEQLNQTLEKLTQVSTELNTSKTDRKTLAKLLATVASNLETGDDE